MRRIAVSGPAPVGLVCIDSAVMASFAAQKAVKPVTWIPLHLGVCLDGSASHKTTYATCSCFAAYEGLLQHRLAAVLPRIVAMK
ncbi:hypothetical protein EJ02DRAFT_455691 [Clathrospora elynae]|uniref:Uncharacterized protein n=1 Tax=Clathrospora elynae TaxID=706981 RepID=A0A6A5SN54_9PLEO|nr:hypothetical protein EJ02DRAFT_455691 [Clathrospora elynae]